MAEDVENCCLLKLQIYLVNYIFTTEVNRLTNLDKF